MDRYEKFAVIISDIYRYVQRIERTEMVKRGYKGSYAQFLATLNRCPEGLTSIRLCEVCGKDKAAVSRSIAEMEEKGLVKREKTNGGYRSKITLTEKGKETAEFVSERSRVIVKAVSDGVMSEEERETFYRVLGEIGNNLQTVIKNGASG